MIKKTFNLQHCSLICRSLFQSQSCCSCETRCFVGCTEPSRVPDETEVSDELLSASSQARGKAVGCGNEARTCFCSSGWGWASLRGLSSICQQYHADMVTTCLRWPLAARVPVGSRYARRVGHQDIPGQPNRRNQMQSWAYEPIKAHKYIQ